MELNGRNLIGYQEYSNGNSTFQTIHPTSLELLPTLFSNATFEETDKAVQLASSAFEMYASTTRNQRIKFFQAIHHHILDLGSDLMDIFQEESGLSFQRAVAERTRTLGQIQLFIEIIEKGDWMKASIDSPLPDRKPIPKPDIRKQLEPVGPIVVFGASNFPLAYSTAGGDTISALASGCPVIVKSHPMHAGTGELVARAIIQAAKETNMPEGVFSNLNSNTYEIGSYLVKHPHIKAVGFTGSITGGTALMKIANKRTEPIPVYAEMGSVNPVVVLPEILELQMIRTVQQLAQSIRLDAGQFCTHPGLIFTLDSSLSHTFRTQLATELNTQKPQAMLHPDIWNVYQKNSASHLAFKEVQEITTPRELVKNHITPTLTTTSGKTFLKNPLLAEEVFGSYSLVIVCTNLTELTSCLDRLKGQLTGSIFATPKELISKRILIQTLKSKVGRLIFNGVPTGVEVCQSMHHGGPYPATSHSHYGAVGHEGILRWTRPVSYQNWPDELLPKALQNSNPMDIMRTIDGEWSHKKLA